LDVAFGRRLDVVLVVRCITETVEVEFRFGRSEMATTGGVVMDAAAFVV
jgi:hypothetical protein